MLKNPKLIIGLFILAVVIGYFIYTKGSDSQKRAKPSPITAPVKSSVELNAPFKFNIPQDGKRALEQIKFTILRAERKDEIKVKGEVRKASEGHDFLLLRLELDNPSPQRIQFISSDFIRLLGAEDKKYSPDFHNGTIILDPISVRKDLVSFIVDQNIKKFTFLVGELDKDKQELNIEFQ